MDEPDIDESKQDDASPAALDIQAGDSASTRKQKKLLQILSREQKLSLGMFVLLMLTLPLTLIAIYNPTRILPQASTPQPTPVRLDTQPLETPSPTPTPKAIIFPAP